MVKYKIWLFLSIYLFSPEPKDYIPDSLESLVEMLDRLDQEHN